MNQALLYRPAPKWHLATALALAAALHLSAVALAARHVRRPADAPPDSLMEVEVPPPDDSPPVPPVEVPLPPPPPSLPAPPDFVDPIVAPRPPLNSYPPSRLRPPGPTRSAVRGNPRVFALNAPRPEYPYEARSRRVMGSGVAVMEVDGATGVVRNVQMEQSIGNPILDNATLSAFRRWRFPPGTVTTVRIPVTFTMAGVSY